MKFTVSVTGRVGAPAVVVYDTIADYRHAHPQILPRQFSDLRVVDGGVGAGTVITFRTHLLGMTQLYKGTVTEPEPGRVVVETYTEPAPSVTTFIVNDAGAASDVTITTDFETGRSGLAGLIERFLVERLVPPMYREELRNLETVARAR